MRRANVQLQADRRGEILARGADLFCALGLPPDLDAGDLRRGRHEPGQSLSLLPLQGRRSSPASRSATAPSGAAVRGRRQWQISSTALRRSRSTIWSSAAPRKSRSVPRSWRRAAAIPPSRASIRTWRRTCASASSRCCAARAERGEIRRDIDFDGTVTVLFALADGLSWRRAVEPSFNAEAVMPIVLGMVRAAARQPGNGQRQDDRGTSHESAAVSPPSASSSRAAAWIASGHLFPHETRGKPRRGAARGEASAEAVPRVGHAPRGSSRAAASSCCPAAPRPTSKMMVTARADGVISELKVRRGSAGQEGRRHRRALRRGARGAGAAGEGHADAAQDRARGDA